MSQTDLLALTAELVNVPSVSHQETAMADLVVGQLEDCPWLRVERIGDNVVARTELGRSTRVLLAGHLDTVNPAPDTTTRIDGDVLWGIGAADMKGGLAVMLDLARSLHEPAMDVTWCFYAAEEVARIHSGLGRIWSERPDLMVADAAILGEPTDAVVEAGCQGSLRFVVHLGGIRAHTARPYTGRNAIHRLSPLLDRVTSWEGRSVSIEGCVYTEQLQAVAVEGGAPSNVVPDHAALTLNYRFAPDRDAAGSHRFVTALTDGLLDESLDDRWEILDEAPAAPPSLGHRVLAALVQATGAPPRAKAAWTDVATMWEHSIPAANFGPGDPQLAHRPDERVTRQALERVRSVLFDLLASSNGTAA